MQKITTKMVSKVFRLQYGDGISRLGKCCSPHVDDLCVILKGANGIGKTTFIKHFIQKKLENADILVLSPTHMLYQKYNENDIIIYHIDLYNYQSLDKSELTEMKQIIDSKSIKLFERPGCLSGFIPTDHLDINLTYDINYDRFVEFKSSGERSTDALQKILKDAGKFS